MRCPIVVFVLVVTAGPAAAEDYPHVFLKNDKLKVKVYLPDAEKGFYRGARFDHAGVFGEIEFAGHKIFGPWKEKHDPTNHDDIIGPCEEFGIEKPLGYDEAKVGGTFLKIGVGELEKPKEEKYSFANKYKIVKPAEWKQVETKHANVITWTLEQKANGFGYRYTKSLLLGERSVGITHLLENTGDKSITTDFYNHNFFNVDGDPVGPNYSFKWPFAPKAENMRGKFGDLVELKGKELCFKEKLTDGFVMAGLTGFPDPLKEKRVFLAEFVMRHSPSGISIDVDHTYTWSKVNVWGIKTTICPEVFLPIKDLRPGGAREWTIGYYFEHTPPKK